MVKLLKQKKRALKPAALILFDPPCVNDTDPAWAARQCYLLVRSLQPLLRKKSETEDQTVMVFFGNFNSLSAFKEAITMLNGRSNSDDKWYGPHQHVWIKNDGSNDVPSEFQDRVETAHVYVYNSPQVPFHALHPNTKNNFYIGPPPKNSDVEQLLAGKKIDSRAKPIPWLLQVAKMHVSEKSEGAIYDLASSSCSTLFLSELHGAHLPWVGIDNNPESEERYRKAIHLSKNPETCLFLFFSD